MNLLQLVKARKTFGARVLFDDASFSIEESQHIGVMGPNGAGKTTLFKILAGLESLDSGEIVKKKNLKIGYLRQHDPFGAEESVEDYLLKNAQIPIWEIKSWGRGLGIKEALYAQRILSLSGGYQTRIKLLSLLVSGADILLLDEPTNYLDLESTLVLESFLQETQAAFMLISHDREFLRRTTDSVLEIENGDFTSFSGSLDDYFDQKEMLRTQLEARALTQAQKRKEILDFVSRFGAKASKARQAQSRLKQLGKMDSIVVKPLPLGARIHIPEPLRSGGKLALSLKECELGYTPGKPVIAKLSLDVFRGDHLAVVGVNGAGKSTFLKTLASRLSPLTGEYQIGHEHQIAYFNQHVSEGLIENESIFESLRKAASIDVSDQQIKNMAGSLLFSGDDITKKIKVLSGGEKSRVALGQILLQRASIIVLDEPTNHLDFQTVEALAEALDRFPGTYVVVSHDRGFVKKIANKILEVNSGILNLYPGSFDEYVWSQKQKLLSDPQTRSVEKTVPQGVLTPTPNSQAYEISKQRKKDLARIEKLLQQTETELSRLQLELNSFNETLDPSSKSDMEKLQTLSQSLAEKQTLKDDYENQWLKLSDS